MAALKDSEFVLTQLVNIKEEESLSVLLHFQGLTVKSEFVEKHITSQNPRFLACLLKAMSQSPEIRLSEKLYNIIVLPYLNTPSKIVQAPLTFLLALDGLEAPFNQKEELLKCLNPELFINKTSFFQKASKLELCALLSAYTKCFPSESEVLLGILYAILKNKSITTYDIKKHFSKTAVNNLAALLYIESFYKELERNKVSLLMLILAQEAKQLDERSYRKALYCLYTNGSKAIIERFKKNCDTEKISSFLAS
jgi:hypothetical protein